MHTFKVAETYTKLETKAEERKFERDLDKLRNSLGVTVVYQGGRYALRDAGKLLGVMLSADALRAIAFLLETTEDNPQTHTVLQPLLDTILRLTDANQLRQLERASAELRVDLRRLDVGEISADVWEKVRFARDKKRCVRFFYRSPAQPNNEGVLHTVEPHEILFERGHFYLSSYCLESRDADGVVDGEKWLRYRLDRIVADDVEVIAKSVKQRTKPRVRIKFKVAPQLWRGGVSRRFEKMEIVEVDEEGWAVISAETDSLDNMFNKGSTKRLLK